MGRTFKPRRKLSNGELWISPKWYVEFRDSRGVQRRRSLPDDHQKDIATNTKIPYAKDKG